MNDVKKGIDQLKSLIEKKKQDRASKRKHSLNLNWASFIHTASSSSAEFQSEEAEIIDDEEFQYLKKVKDLKQLYREAYDQLKQTRSEVDYLSRVVDRCREKLILDFESWYQDSFDFSGTGSGSSNGNSNAGSSMSLLANLGSMRLSDEDIRDDVGGAEVSSNL